MVLPRFVTFTGLDERTDFERVKSLSSRFPIEWGILIDGSTDDTRPRYPSSDLISKALETDGLKLSLHICGKLSKKILSGDPMKDVALAAAMMILHCDTGLSKFERAQLNSDYYDFERLMRFQRAAERPVIMQTRGPEFPEPIRGIEYLHDESAGRGVVPASRPSQGGHPFVGFAGGNSLSNVTSVIASLDAHDYYLDFETNVRFDDWLDLDICEAICERIWNH
jgi:hypothetical protein